MTTSICFEERDAELLDGVTDLHVYCSPDLYERAFDEISFARQARAVGYRGCISKSHHTMNPDRLQLVRKVVPGFEMHGGVVLNHFVGGLRPETVETAIGLGARIVWMPNIHSRHHITVFGRPGYSHLSRAGEQEDDADVDLTDYLTILDDDGNLLPEVRTIMDLIGEADIILGTGHLSIDEVFAIAKAAPEHNVKKILCAHVETPVTYWEKDQQVAISQLPNVYLTHTYHRCIGDWHTVTPKTIAENIMATGADKCVMASCLGASGHTHPIEGMRLFIRAMLRLGIPQKDVEMMTKTTPADLLGI